MKHLVKFNENYQSGKMDYQLVENFLSTLFHSWGSDAGPECTWAANDFLKILEQMYGYQFQNEFSESDNDDNSDNNYEVVLEEIKQLLS